MNFTGRILKDGVRIYFYFTSKYIPIAKKNVQRKNMSFIGSTVVQNYQNLQGKLLVSPNVTQGGLEPNAGWTPCTTA